MFERIIHVCEFAEIFGHRVEFVVFNSPANGTVLFDDVGQVAFFGEEPIKFFDGLRMEHFHLVGDDACRVSVFIPKVREKLFRVFFAERVRCVAFVYECFLDVFEPRVAGNICFAERADQGYRGYHAENDGNIFRWNDFGDAVDYNDYA